MDKVLIVARTEFANAVRTKAFLVSILMLPFIYGIMFFVQIYASKADVEPRKFAVLDHTGKLFPSIKAAADFYNKSEDVVDKAGKAKAPTFVPSLVKEEGKSPEETLLALSDKVRSGELYAFIEIPKEIVEAKASTDPIIINYYSNSPNYRGLSGWLDVVVGTSARLVRYQAAGLNPTIALKIDRPVKTETLGLSSRAMALAPAEGDKPETKPGAIIKAKQIDPIRSMAVPVVLAMLVYIITMTQPQQLVSTVMEEKMSRISEMLLGSLSPFQLLMGKLIGNVGTALVTTSLYVFTAYLAAVKFGYGDVVTPGLVATLFLFLTLAIFLFGSMFIAVGSACSDLKDAQSLITPVMMFAIIPVMLVGPVLTNPTSTLAVWASMFPSAAPTLMTMRMAMSPAPPVWQVVLSITLTILSTVGCVWASAKIFRTALLMHGKAPTFRELARWVVAR